MNIIQGDCIEVLRRLPANSFDGCLCDPPYGLEFMGVAWDTFDRPKGTPRTRNEWGDFGSREHARKPEERGRIQRNKGLSLQHFSTAWATEVLRVLKPGAFMLAFGGTRTYHRLACAIEDAGFEIRDCIMWLYGSGFPKHGSCLKPAWEPIIVARKSGKGLLNIDACRIGIETRTYSGSGPHRIKLDNHGKGDTGIGIMDGHTRGQKFTATGRWPANVILDEEAAAALDQQSGITTSGAMRRDIGAYQRKQATATKFLRGSSGPSNQHPDSGGASRFFYCAKASRKERGEGNTHPTVKPLKLAEYLARLILPGKNARLIVPFAGSGSEMIGATRAGWKHITGIEREPAYAEMSRQRLELLPAGVGGTERPVPSRIKS